MITTMEREEFIRKIIRQKGVEEAPGHLTDRIMSKIQESPATKEAPLLSPGAWIAIISSVAALLIMIFVVDIPFFGNLFSPSEMEKISSEVVSANFLDSFLAFFKSIHLSSITFTIIAAAVFLVLLERLVLRRFMHFNLFSIL